MSSVARADTSSGRASDASNLPAPGTSLKFGIYTDDPNLQAVDSLLGYKLNIMGWFIHWNGTVVNNKLKAACTSGYLPEITWESWSGSNTTNPYPLADIADGKYDGQIRAQLQAIRNVCKNQTVIVRFDHEMDLEPGFTSWYPWQGNPEQYTAAWRHVVDIGRAADPNIKWLWSPNRGTPTTLEYYPGNKWVDYVGLSLNHEDLATEVGYQTFGQFYEANQTVIEAFNKPIIISETTSAENLGNKADWVTGMFNYAESNPKITALVWFNGTAAAQGYSYDSSPTTLTAFQQSLAHLQTLDSQTQSVNHPKASTTSAPAPKASKPTALQIITKPQR